MIMTFHQLWNSDSSQVHRLLEELESSSAAIGPCCPRGTFWPELTRLLPGPGAEVQVLVQLSDMSGWSYLQVVNC